jgi:uncharacterized protein with HEPN domain
MSRDSATLLDMLKASRLVIEFKEGMTKASFLNDSKTRSAVILQLLILGEATKRLSEEFRAQHQTIPWRQIAGMRDKLIHDYDEVWKTAGGDIPQLITQLEPLVPPEE